ncbi:MAG: RNA polymerase factor sigma-54 [Phycisphaerae bacterium]
MRLDTSQQLQLSQQMKLAPRIIQAMEILQLPMMALQERIDQEMEANPVLEMSETPDEQEVVEPVQEEEPELRGERDLVVDDDHGNSEDFSRLSDYEDEFGQENLYETAIPTGPSSSGGVEASNAKMEAMANTADRGQTLNEYLLDQWRFVEVDEETRRLGELIINNLEDDGYLRTRLDELAAGSDLETTEQQLEDTLGIVQTLDPTGIAARDLKECLHLQLQAAAASGAQVGLEMELVLRYLRDIEMNRLPRIAKRTGKSMEEIKQGIDNLSRLNPRPGLLIGERSVPIVSPDVIVELDEDDQIVVRMADGNTPNLYISDTYKKLAKLRSTDPKARKYLRRNIRSADWLIGAIEQRRDTVYRVVKEVFKVQREFLEHGTEALKPLPMADVAEKVEVHVATVSRAVSGKYVQTPKGIFPLRMFFSGGTKTADGDDMAWDAVKAKLREVVDNEDKSKPLNDEKLAKELQKHGIDIARRTVAKYRNILDIPSARKRREY